MSTRCYRGVPLKTVYRNLSEWELDHLPPIINKRDHIVLFQFPIKTDPTQPPEPHIESGGLKWDSHHVKFPCATQNEYKTESAVNIFRIDVKIKHFIHIILKIKICDFCRVIQVNRCIPHDGISFRRHYCVISTLPKNWNELF